METFLVYWFTIVTFINVVLVWVLLFRKKKSNSTEFYTDYVCGKLTMRIFKPEFEYQAIGDVKRGAILDRGILSPAYNWALLEDKV